MPAFHIVVKVLMLRLLLANLAGLALAYDFGYHPSAEEFDSLLRETRGWTRDLLANEHRRSDSYVPRYRYEQESPKSELDFHMFSDDQEQLEQQPFVYESVAPLTPPQAEQQMQMQMHVQGQLMHITDNLAPAAASTAAGASSNSYGNGSSSGNFPIFFTNPATGIVYAISEVGRNTKSQPWPGAGAGAGNDSDAIAIYVTKQQYDADLQALRQQYEQQCPMAGESAPQIPLSPASASQSSAASVLSTSQVRPPLGQSSSTARPQIIRLQRPKKPAMPSKLPHKPPPVMVPSGATGAISDQLLKLPTTTARPRGGPKKTQKPKRNKRKKKKKTPKRRPGHKVASTPTTTQGPQIVLGKRTTSTTSRPPTSAHLATQLEKPHMPPQPTATLAGSQTIFSEHPFVVSNGFIEVPHHLIRRSVQEANPGSAGARPVSSGRRRPSSSGGGGKRRSSGTGRGGSGGGGKKQRRSGDNEIPTKATGNTQNGESGYHVPRAVHLLHGRHGNGSEERQQEAGGSREHVKLQARRRSAEVDFDLFELMTGSDYEDNDDAYDYDSDKEHHKSSASQVKRVPQSPSQENSSSAEEGADFGAMEEEPSSSTTALAPADTTSEQVGQDGEKQGSSSKQSASKKRIKRRPSGDNKHSDEYYDEEEEDDDEDEKDSDLDADAESDSDSDSDSFGGFGSFFRMVFYPVQLAMTRIFDGITGTSDEQSEVDATAKPKYPTYTLYHSAHSNNELVDDADEDDDEGGSLGSWFSSWFGLRRRTKKIGSTTAMPLAPVPVPLPTPAPQPEEADAEPESVGWLESWFGFGKTKAPASSEEDDYDSEYTYFNSPESRKIQ